MNWSKCRAAFPVHVAAVVISMFASTGAQGAHIVSTRLSIWELGKIPYWLPLSDFPRGDETAERIRYAVNSWNKNIGCAVELVELDSAQPPKRPHLEWRKAGPRESSRASIGYQPFGRNAIVLSDSCTQVSCMLHMIAHVAGLAHEHQRCEEPAMIESTGPQGERRGLSVFPLTQSPDQLSVSEPDWSQDCKSYLLENYGSYDFASITHYSSNEVFAPMTAKGPRWVPTPRGTARLKTQGLSSLEVGMKRLSAGDLSALQYLYRASATCEALYACPLPTDPRPYIRPVDPIACQGGGAFLARRGDDNHYHKGLDLEAQEGTPVYAIRGGRIAVAREKWSGYGTTVVIDHGDGLVSVYGHLGKNIVEVSDETVQTGQLIGTVGYTGNAQDLQACGRPPHLHFELVYAGEATFKGDWTTRPLDQIRKLGDGWACSFLTDLESSRTGLSCLGELPIGSRTADSTDLNDWIAGALNPEVVFDERRCWDAQMQGPFNCPKNKRVCPK